MNEDKQIGEVRRYLFKLYLTNEQEHVLRNQCAMIALLWNGLLERHEEIQRRTVQRQQWQDASGKRHSGVTIHNPNWTAQRKKNGEIAIVEPGKNGRPKPYTDIDMQNEVTWLCNQMPEWREMSVWCGHRTAQLLHRAFEAFYRRLKELSDPAVYEARAQKFIERKGRKPTRHELAGYPRFKRVADHNSIPHRFLSGCKLVPTPRVGRKQVHDNHGQAIGPAQHRRSWQLTLKGVPGVIHARGQLPGEALEWLDADVMWRDGSWWISACIRIARAEPRQPGHAPTTIKFDLLDDMAEVNGIAETPAELVEVSLLQDSHDEMKSGHDLKWPRDIKLVDEAARAEREESRAALRGLAARIARKRTNALHVWTAGIVRRASDITIIAPPIQDSVRTPRGGERSWGASIGPVSALNRKTLSQAPATAIQMILYKAEEAGLPEPKVINDDTPKIAVGSDLVTAGKTLRRARREIRRAA